MTELPQGLIYQVWKVVYNLYFHPLARFPGPKLAAVSKLPSVYNIIKGNSHKWSDSLHRQYGDVVRIGPDSLSYCNSAAWKEIYGFRKDKKFIKDPLSYGAPPNGVPGLLSANDENHARFRRTFSHAFSDRALREQEPLFMEYIDLLVKKLNEKVAADPDVKINMVNMLNFTTFDIMADLTFGKPLGMLAKSEYHPWVTAIFSSLKLGTYMRSLKNWPLLAPLSALIVPSSLRRKRMEHFRWSSEQVDARLKRKSDKPDIWNLVLAADESRSLTLDEMHSNGGLFMGAGTETTATELSGSLYLLSKHPDVLEHLLDELRTAFPAGAPLTIDGLAHCKYLGAVLEEGLRVYPPVPAGLPRVVPSPQGVILGAVLPGETRVFVSQYATYHSPRNFVDSDSYRPERWLPADHPLHDARFDADDKVALQPFSIGPRNCIGKNLAYHEMKLVLAALVLNFEFTLCDESGNWMDQRMFALWEKKPLIMTLKPVKR